MSYDDKVEDFFFTSAYSTLDNKWKWKKQTKISTFFEVVNNVDITNHIYSYFQLVRKFEANMTLDLEFVMEDYQSGTKSCSIKNVHFRGESNLSI